MSMSKSNKSIFPGQRENEEIIMIVFKHWYIAIMPMLKALGIILLSLFLPILLGLTFYIFNYTISTVAYIVWILFWVGYIFYAYFNWLQDKYIITNERIVNIDKKGAFNTTVREAEIDKIQNITHSTKGMFATMLNFGTVILQTATGELILDYVPNPVYIKEEILQLIKGQKHV